MTQKKKMSYPPCAKKWCALVLACIEAASNYLEEKDKSIDKSAKDTLMECIDTLKTHSASVSEISQLNCQQLHVESRIMYDDKGCVLVFAPGRHLNEGLAIQNIITITTGCKPTEGPAPPTKAERANMKTIQQMKKAGKKA